jgi:RimJ/RimL family protein N-acetyltransferase
VSTVEVHRVNDPAAFFDRVRPLLLAAEAEHSVPLGLEPLLRCDPAPFGAPAYLALVERDGDVVGCAYRTPPHPLGLTRMPAAAVPLLAEHLARACPDLTSLLGPDPEAGRLAELWADVAGGSCTTGTRMRIWSTQRLIPPTRPCVGRLRPATEADRQQIVEWTGAFASATGLSMPDPRRLVDTWLAAGDVFLWEDEDPRAMVAVSGWTPHGARIGYVYTPEAWRGRGYGTSCTYELSRRCLEAGRRFCCLYTDRANPTSNAIYRRIGYLPIGDVTEYELEAGRPEKNSE